MNNIFGALTIRGRVLTLSLALSAMIVLVSTFSYYSISSIGVELASIAEQDIPLTKSLADITVHQLEQAIRFERILYNGKIHNKDSKTKQYYEKQIEEFRLLNEKVDAELIAIESLAKDSIAVAVHSEEIDEFTSVLHGLEKIEKEHRGYGKKAEELITLFSQNEMHRAIELAETIEVVEEHLDHELETLLQEIENFTQAAALRVEEHEQTSEGLLLIISLVSILAGAGFGSLVSGSIQKRLDEVANSLNLIAQGDFGEVMGGNDEIAIPMRRMRDQLMSMIQKIDVTTSQLADTAENLSTITSQTNSNVQGQQRETEQVANAMSEMRVTVQEVSENVQEVSNMAKRSNEEAVTGASVVEDTVEGINKLSDKLSDASMAIGNVESDSNNINSVLDVIKGVAEQTNLLALNAAIEAARAGEQGRGFAVVADEVRTLAVRTQESTSEINLIIEKLNIASKKAVFVMDESREQAKVLVDKSGLAGTSLNVIVESISRIDAMSEQIASAAHEQSAVTDNMSQNVKRINSMAVDNTQGANEIRDISVLLACIATELQESIGQFKLQY